MALQRRQHLEIPLGLSDLPAKGTAMKPIYQTKGRALEYCLEWTTEPPKVIGWYFWKSDTFNGHGYTNTVYVDDVHELSEALPRCKHKNIMFAGPIPEPRNCVIKHDLRVEMEG